MSEQNILFVVLLIWGIPSTYFRSRFRKIVYATDDWKINIKPLFKKELIALFQIVCQRIKRILRPEIIIVFT
ncbi:hypothetical protein OAF88_05500 [Cyclobacteriaceae bacterium]|nr:hypothetical protein [Cyclobacteriaceae bacterium]